MKTEDLEEWLPLLLIGGAVFFLIKFGSNLSDDLGLSPTPAVVTDQTNDPQSPWSSSFYNANAGPIFDYATVSDMVNYIASRFLIPYVSVVNQDGAVLGTVKKCATQLQLSQLAVVYQQLQGSDLLTDMIKYMSQSDVTEAVNYVNNLPTT